MNDLDIRLAMLNQNHRARIKELMLSSGDLDIIDCLNFGDETSRQVAKTLMKSTQTISTRLKALRDKGYVTRTEHKDETGGIYFSYRSIYKVAL